MISRSCTWTAALAALFIATSPLPANASDTWGYAHGTEQWGLLDPAYATCSSGLQQSPIDVIRANARHRLLPSLAFHYAGSTTLDVANHGHTIQGVAPGTGNTLRIGSKTYTLVQFHFHTPSENFLDGEQYPLELHLVHKAADNSLAVVGVFFDEGTANPELQKIIAATPDAEGEHASAPGFKLNALIPHGPIYRFAGSLTTPPCSEGVAWHVASVRKTASMAQLAAFSARFSGHEFPGGNRRPVQARHGRPVFIGH
jgi:carbonic anhydrase